MEVKAVIFDLDGTLFDSIEDIADANNEMLKEFGCPAKDLKDYVSWIGNGAKRLVELSLPLHMRNGNIQPYLEKYKFHYRNHINKKSKLFPNIDQVLDLLAHKNIPIAINTNKPQHLTDIVVEHYLKKWPFQNVIGHSNSFPHKPDPSGALHFAKQIACDPQNILFVGDSVVDIQTAKAAGMMPLGVSWGYGHPGMESDEVIVVDTPNEMIDCITVKMKI